MRPQLYVGLNEPTEENFRPAHNREGGWIKPIGGLWTSTYSQRFGSGWVQWCLDADFSVPPDGWTAWLLSPDPSARVLTVDSLADLQTLCQRYAAAPCRGMCNLNFEAIARDFDAVRLTDRGQWATRLTHPHSLYGWDCESTVWLRWSFLSIRSLGVHHWPSRSPVMLA